MTESCVRLDWGVYDFPCRITLENYLPCGRNDSGEAGLALPSSVGVRGGALEMEEVCQREKHQEAVVVGSGCVWRLKKDPARWISSS